MMTAHAHRSALATTVALSVLLLPGLASAYVGPGAGLSLLTALWGIVAAIGVAVLFVIMWPIRRLRKRRKAAADESAARVAEPPVDETPAGHTEESPRPTDDDRRV